MYEIPKLRTGVLLVNYRQWELTEKCIRSLLAQDSSEMIIGLVDNCSEEPPPEWIAEHPRIMLHMNMKNEGLTAGNNIAFNMVSSWGADYVFILNNDTEVAPGTVRLLSEYLYLHPETGIAAPAVSYASDPEKIWSAGGYYSKTKMKLTQKYHRVEELPESPEAMEQVTGCAMMMRTTDYRRAGMQDPALFVYYEDTDLCFKVKKLGLKIMLIPEGRVIHHVSISVGGVFSPFAIYFTHRNRYIIAARHLEPIALVSFLVYYFAVTLYKSLLYPFSDNGELVGSMWLGFFHGILNRPDKRPASLFPSREKA